MQRIQEKVLDENREIIIFGGSRIGGNGRFMAQSLNK
jgi:hypothetical protein